MIVVFNCFNRFSCLPLVLVNKNQCLGLMVLSENLGKLEQAVNLYFVHILSLVTDNNPS